MCALARRFLATGKLLQGTAVRRRAARSCANWAQFAQRFLRKGLRGPVAQNYFPMQNLLKIRPRISSLVISPVSSAILRTASLTV